MTYSNLPNSFEIIKRDKHHLKESKKFVDYSLSHAHLEIYGKLKLLMYKLLATSCTSLQV